jgi:hypothetical protein
MGGYYSWRQLQLLGKLRSSTEPSQDRRFQHTQAVRRLVCSALIVVFAILLCGSYFLQDIRPHEQATEEDKQALYLFSAYWIFTFILFLTILCLAAVDILATRRFTLRQLRQLHEEHEGIIAQQAARVRGQRNGQQ